jgi:hypothetical protein
VRTRLAALLVAVLASGTPANVWAQASSPAPADTASPFEVVPRSASPRHSYKWAWITAIAGAALVGVSFPLADEADRRYNAYLAETDVSRIDERFRATQSMDRLASGALLAGEGMLATAVWLRFVRGDRRVAFDVRTDRCALAVRF